MKYHQSILIIAITFFSAVSMNSQSLENNSNEMKYVCGPCNRRCDEIIFNGPGICEHCNMKRIPIEELKNYPKQDRKNIGFYLQSGVEILDLAGSMEVFNYAGYDVFTISKTKDKIYTQGILSGIPDYDLIVVKAEV